MSLTEKKCVPCEGGIPALSHAEAETLKTQLHKSWKNIDDHHLQREFYFVNFRQTMDFVSQLAALAEEEGHHPVMHVHYAKCIVDLWTHALDGLSENDFILAAKIDRLN